MGSFGSIFAVVMVGMVIMTSFSVLAKVLSEYEGLIFDLPSDSCSRPSIYSGFAEDQTTCFVNITLYGSKGVPISKMRLVDVFVAYRSDEGIISTRLEYGSGWSISRVLLGNSETELVNPTNLSRETGLWDPGETLELRLSLPFPSETNKWYFLIVLPDGGSCSWNFS